MTGQSLISRHANSEENGGSGEIYLYFVVVSNALFPSTPPATLQLPATITPSLYGFLRPRGPERSHTEFPGSHFVPFADSSIWIDPNDPRTHVRRPGLPYVILRI